MFEFIDKIKNFFEKQACALFLSDSKVQVVKLDHDDNVIKIEAAAEAEIPETYLHNGEILEEKKVAEIIQDLLKKNSIKTKQCLLALSENQCFEHIFHLSKNLKGDDFIAELEKQIEERIPLPFHEVKYDYFSFSQGDQQIVFVVAVRREVIAQYYQVTKDFADIEPLTLEPASLSLIRNIPISLNPKENILLVDTDANKITWFVLMGGKIFDSNTTQTEEVNNQINAFTRDIVNSLRNFVNTSGSAVTKIVFSGDKNINSKLISLLQNLKIPIEQVENYKIPNPKFKVTCGLALKPKVSKLETEINLLKK